MAIFSQCSKDYFRDSVKIGKSSVLTGTVCNIKKHKVIRMTLCVHAINSVVRINNSTLLWNDNIWESLITQDDHTGWPETWKSSVLTGNSYRRGQRSVCNIKKHKVIRMTLCVHAINSVVRINNSTLLWNDNIWESLITQDDHTGWSHRVARNLEEQCANREFLQMGATLCLQH